MVCLTYDRLVRKWSATLKNDGITTVLLHPGKFEYPEIYVQMVLLMSIGQAGLGARR
jgi:hypothetical protein